MNHADISRIIANFIATCLMDISEKFVYYIFMLAEHFCVELSWICESVLRRSSPRRIPESFGLDMISRMNMNVCN